MLLACCFRQPKNKKHKKNKKWGKEKLTDNEETYRLTESLISTPLINSNVIQSDYSNETTNLQEINQQICEISSKNGDGIKVGKGRFQPNSASKSATVQNGPGNETRTSSFPNTSVLQTKHQLNSKDMRHMFASVEDLGSSELSVDSTYTSTCTDSPPHPSGSTSNPTKVCTNEPTNDVTKDEDDTFDGEGYNTIDNKCSYKDGDQHNLEKIDDENQEIQTAEKEEIHKTLREEYKRRIKALNMDHQTELEKVKETYQKELTKERENNYKEIEKAKIYAKNEANETISQLNKQIVLERGKMFAEQQEQNKRLEEEYRMKGERLNQSIKENEIREQCWQDEKEGILREVQRLKAEATKMVKTLAMEYEQDNLGEDKKRSLSQEVYSLQLVIEMKTGEVKNLRVHLAKAIHELEQYETAKEKLKKATLRIEDLEEQLKIKSKLEKQLSLEKTHLEQNLSHSSKAVDRMSKDVETLQWRIRNNFDLPGVNLCSTYHHKDIQNSSMSSVSSYADNKQELIIEPVAPCPYSSTPVTDKKLESNQRKTNLFMVSDEMIEATTSESDHKDLTSEFHPCYEGDSLSSDDIKNGKNVEASISKFEVKHSDDITDLDIDIDSLDEGVGDISSDGDGEHGSSPIDNKTTIEDNSLTHNQSKISSYNTITDRIPSRFGLP